MKQILSNLLLLAILITTVCFKPFHDTHIKVISPTLNSKYSKGQTVDIDFRVTYEQAIKSVEYSITDQTGKSMLSQNISGDNRKIIEVKKQWPVGIATPAILKLIIKTTDFSGHSNTKKIQFSVNL